MCIVATLSPEATPLPASSCPAKSLTPDQRQDLALQALAGTQPIAHLAAENHVSRKFVYQQADQADHALHQAFHPAPQDQRVLFYLPVTSAWLRQLVLALVLLCHSSYRGVIELLRDLFDYSISVGTVHNIVNDAVPLASQHHANQDLSAIRIAALDEIFQGNLPVLVGCDAHSSYCFLLSLEECRDSDTWAVRLLECVDRGFDPDATIADGGPALRAGQKEAFATVPCRGDVFHVLYEFAPLVGYLENRAYEAIEARRKIEAKLARPGKQRDRQKKSLIQKLRYARAEEAKAIALADDLAVLLCWLRDDVLAVVGPDHAGRCLLYDFVVAQLRERERLCPHRIGPVATMLENRRDNVLAFVAQLDSDLAALAVEHQVSPELARETLEVQALSAYDVRRAVREAALWRRLGGRYYGLREAITELLESVVRASSVVENLNSRLRNYFFLRRQLGPNYLSLLQFFVNHRRFLRSEHGERVGKSPAELLTGQRHPHWLEMLGYTLFKRS
jgi:hypothetical protein